MLVAVPVILPLAGGKVLREAVNGVEAKKAMRDKFQKDKPSLDDLSASGEYTEPVPLGQYLKKNGKAAKE